MGEQENIYAQVTIAIAAYNAADFIVEALESVYSQTYVRIHLIISDDCSSDETVSITKIWLNQERVQNRFLSIQLLTVPVNTGVSANCNRIIRAAKTHWIKFHAGDDLLLPDCIADNMGYIAQQDAAQVLFSQIKVYQDTFEEHNYQRTTPEYFPDNLFYPTFNAQKQFEILLQSDRIHYTPSYFFNKQALAQVGNYDEDNRLVEDYPMWLKLTKAGIRLHYFHTPTVGYRIHGGATNNTGKALFKPSAINGYLVRRQYAHPYLSLPQVKQESWNYYVSQFFYRMNWMNPSAFNRVLYRFLTIYGNPFFWANAIYKRLR